MATTTAVASASADIKPAPMIVGIDFGARYARIAVISNTTSQLEIIPNERGDTATPTFVTWDPMTGDAIIGEDAKAQALLNPENTVFDFKRLLGRTFDSAEVQSAITQLPYKIIDRDNKPVIRVTIKGETREFSPEDITAMVMTKLKHDAERHLGQDVNDAVATVPAYYYHAQRQAMVDAGTIAGWTFQRVINEPTAAVIASGLDKNAVGEQIVLVANWGGGGVDLTVVDVDAGVFEVLAINNQFVHIGTDDIEERIVSHCLSKWKECNRIDLSTDKRALQSLRLAAERAKRALSTETETTITIDSSGGHHEPLTATLSRSLVEEMTKDLVDRMLELIEKAVLDAGVTDADVDEIALVGGASRLPMIHEVLATRFNRKEPVPGMNPDEAVVHGAAMQADIMSRESDDEGDILCHHWPLFKFSLGVETAGGLMHPLVRRSTFYPTTKHEMFTTLHANQTDVTIRAFEGERLFTRDNHFLGQLKLSSLSPSPQIEIQFQVEDEYETLMVSARDVVSGLTENLVIRLKEHSIVHTSNGYDEMEVLYNEAEATHEHDSKIKAQIEQCLNTECVDVGELWELRQELAGTVDAIVPVPTTPMHDEL